MSNQKFINHHSLELLHAALPYMHPSAQKSVEVLTKAEELIDTLHAPAPGELTTMSIPSGPFNMEDMLTQLKGAGNKKEQEFIDNMINIIKMQKLFQNYRSFMSGKPPGSSSQDNMMEFLLSQLSPEQRSNFENINMVLNSMNS